MDIQKAKEAAILYARRYEMETSLKEFLTTYRTKPTGTTSVTIPIGWLPKIASIAEEELAEIDKQINAL